MKVATPIHRLPDSKMTPSGSAISRAPGLKGNFGGLYLAPAIAANLHTLSPGARFATIRAQLSARDRAILLEGLPGGAAIPCWGTTEGNRSAFHRMAPGDTV